MSTEKNNFEESAEEFAKREEQKSNPNSLGKAKTIQSQEERGKITEEMGYIRVPMDSLPSRGMFYPTGTKISIRSASSQEIRHWSTIDENDYNGMDEVLNFVIERCVRINVPGRISSWKDIKEIDRFYLIFAIREFTFKEGENKLYVPTDNGEKVEVRKEMIKYFDLNEKLKKFYNDDEKCLVMNTKSGEIIKCYLPTIGVTQFIRQYVMNKRERGQQGQIDKAFLKYAPFIFPEWRTLNEKEYENAVVDSINWTNIKISTISKISDLLADGVEPKLSYKSPGGAELEAPLNFQGGIKSIFLISDIFDELV